MLLADVAPMSRMVSVSSDLKIRESSAIALERRVSRSWAFGAGDDSGVLRKNLMGLRALDPTEGRIQGRANHPAFVAQYNKASAPAPDHLPCSAGLAVDFAAVVEVAPAGFPAPTDLLSARISNLPLK